MRRRVLVDRRASLAAAPAGVAAVQFPEEAATKPKRPPTSYPGAQMYDDKERVAVDDAVESRSLFRWYGPGRPEKVTAFEQELARDMGAMYALAVTSGTAALHVALTALAAGPGDEVILPAWGWYSCYNAIVMTGALPVFAETDESLNIDPEDVERKITPRNQGGYGAASGRLSCRHGSDHGGSAQESHPCARRRCQSVGAAYKGKRVAAIGEIGIFSFQISKTITAGEGGAVLTSDPLPFERATRFHDLGMLRPGHKERLGPSSMDSFTGVNYRMNEMTGGVMGARLRKLDTILGRLRHNARVVRDRIRDLPELRFRRIPDPEGEIGLGIHLLLPSKDLRDKFVAAMRAERAAAAPPGGSLYLPGVPYIEQKVALHPAWPTFNTPHGKAIRYGAGCCPRTVAIFDRVAVVPIGVRDSEADLDRLAAAIRKAHRVVFG